ncbi:uncharacterized protein LOC114747493 [Neltuma alba]|uniref:uncharacterized protein LOC114747493 n=1 Tax=Neltuma alba TaxID=207710 RepID=UPI0010A42D1E|nr:uncharacterized protein LOC114747493 [Prosopis alba]
MGYIVSERISTLSEGDASEAIAAQSAESKSESVYCLNQGKHDRHCMDSGIDYDIKHADLERSFGVKFPSSGLQVRPREMQRRRTPKLKNKVNGSGSTASVVAMKIKILERSSLAAHTYFQGQLHKESVETISPPGSSDFANQDTFLVKSDVENNAKYVISGDETRNDDRRRVTEVGDHGVRTPSLNANVNVHSDSPKLVQDPVLQTGVRKFENLQSHGDVAEPANTYSYLAKEEKLGPHVAHSQINVKSKGQRNLSSEDSVFTNPRPHLETYLQFPIDLIFMKFGSNLFFRSMEFLFCCLSGSIKKFKSHMGLEVEDSVYEHVGMADFRRSEDTGFFSVTLDSVHIRDATVMLLAYGDREAREIENVNGHVKFQNCYSRLHVQLDGNCKTWRSDIMSEDGGWLSANIFVDTIEQQWHANVKIDNLFVSLFERILEIPITWSKGRASGSPMHVER